MASCEHRRADPVCFNSCTSDTRRARDQKMCESNQPMPCSVRNVLTSDCLTVQSIRLGGSYAAYKHLSRCGGGRTEWEMLSACGLAEGGEMLSCWT